MLVSGVVLWYSQRQILPSTTMTTRLTDDLRQALEQPDGTPVHVVDADTQMWYVVMLADQYEKVRSLFEEEAFDPRELYPLVEQSLMRAGWDDPDMDAYNDYDAHRPQP